MEIKRGYVKLRDLEVYKLGRELSGVGWVIYDNLNWQDKKTIGDQFITATDSYGANITEGYNRYHYLDKIRFYYNARASLAEANDYWIELLRERKKVIQENYLKYKEIANKCSIKLQNFITANYKARDKKQ
jgi:four helix bundle protein